METFTPKGVEEPAAGAPAALSLLRSRLGIDFSPQYHDGTDRRHELAVLAVDLGRRLLDLNARVHGAADLDMVMLTQISRRAQAVDDTLTDEPQGRATTVVPVMHARASEVERTLRLLAAAWKAAWWADSSSAETAAT